MCFLESAVTGFGEQWYEILKLVLSCDQQCDRVKTHPES